MDKLIKDINKKVQILTPNWYHLKVKYFKDEPFYDEKFDKIYTVISNKEYYEDEMGEWIEVQNELIINKSINAYCWNSSFYGSISDSTPEYDENPNYLPIDSENIASEIISLIVEFTEKFEEIRSIQGCIKLIVAQLLDWINQNSKQNAPLEFIECIDDFVNQTQRLIYKKFEYVQRQIEILERPYNHLDFELSQEQLAGLLFILNKSEFLRPVKSNKDNFLRFCCEFFYFKFKGDYVKPSNFKSFSDKYNKYVRGENTIQLNELKNKLRYGLLD